MPSAKYDLILVNVGPPSTLQANRYYTEEFFRTARAALKPDGILFFPLPGTLTYYNAELLGLNASVLSALRNVFPHVRVIPGDSVNFYLASENDGIMSLDADTYSQRLAASGIQTRLLNPRHFQLRLQDQWQAFFDRTVGAAAGSAPPNRDFQPRAVYYAIAQWNLMFSPATQKLFNWAGRIHFRHALTVAALLLVCLLLPRRARSAVAVPAAIATTGLAGMMFELVLMLAFQVLYGVVYYAAGLLITAFMVGIAVGSGLATWSLGKPGSPMRAFLHLDAALVLFALMLSGALRLAPLAPNAPAWLVHFALILLLILAGGLMGAQFPLANRLVLDRAQATKRPAQESARAAGILYGFDLLGGWMGGILGGLLLLPVLGLVQVCLLLAVLKTASSLVLLSVRTKSPQSATP